MPMRIPTDREGRRSFAEENAGNPRPLSTDATYMVIGQISGVARCEVPANRNSTSRVTAATARNTNTVTSCEVGVLRLIRLAGLMSRLQSEPGANDGGVRQNQLLPGWINPNGVSSVCGEHQYGEGQAEQ